MTTLPGFGQPISRMDAGVGDLTGVIVTAPVGGDVLIYDGADWRNQTITGDISIDAAGVVAITPGSIVDADINGAAAIAVTKLALGVANSVLASNGAVNSWDTGPTLDDLTVDNVQINGNTISSSAGDLILDPAGDIVPAGTRINYGENSYTLTASAAGVARYIQNNISVGAGGAANASVRHRFQLDSIDEAGLFGETNGAGGVTATTQVWKVPYRDSGANVAAPVALNVEVLGGMRVEAGDDDNRIYFRANEAWHYVSQTAGFSFLYEEPTTFGDFNHWHHGDLMVLKVDRYKKSGGHALPYPLERALQETAGWREHGTAICEINKRLEDKGI